MTNYNACLEQYADAEAKGDTAAMIALQGAIKFNGGGHVNHSIFWSNLAPPAQGGGGAPEGDLATLIDAEFGSFDVRGREGGREGGVKEGGVCARVRRAQGGCLLPYLCRLTVRRCHPSRLALCLSLFLSPSLSFSRLLSLSLSLSAQNFKAKFNAQTAAVQGSGWGWLGYDQAKGRVAIATTANQDPCVTTGLVPLLGIDIWEHAYYLQVRCGDGEGVCVCVRRRACGLGRECVCMHGYGTRVSCGRHVRAV